MAVKTKTISREDYIKTLGFTPTDEQISTMPETFNIEVEVEDTAELTWEQAQAKYQAQIDAEKAKAVKARLGNKNKTGEIDFEAIKAQAIADATNAAIKATKLDAFVNTNELGADKGKQFITLVESSIAAGQTLDQAIASNTGLFVQQKGKVIQNDLGQRVVQEPGQTSDPIMDALEAAIQNRE